MAPLWPLGPPGPGFLTMGTQCGPPCSTPGQHFLSSRCPATGGSSGDFKRDKSNPTRRRCGCQSLSCPWAGTCGTGGRVASPQTTPPSPTAAPVTLWPGPDHTRDMRLHLAGQRGPGDSRWHRLGTAGQEVLNCGERVSPQPSWAQRGGPVPTESETEVAFMAGVPLRGLP